jgi:hypothetical protein
MLRGERRACPSVTVAPALAGLGDRNGTRFIITASTSARGEIAGKFASSHCAGVVPACPVFLPVPADRFWLKRRPRDLMLAVLARLGSELACPGDPGASTAFAKLQLKP